MLGGVAYAMFPVLLPASTDPAYAITVFNAAAASYGLKVGVIWWSIGMAIALGYFIYLYRSFKGKVTLEGEGH
jgi:cytochrome d ubiquinol oxidase subunit II